MPLLGASVSVVLSALGLLLAADAPVLAPSSLGTPAGAGAAGPADVVVTAAPPVDAERLADALRAYLDEYGVRVGSADFAEPQDLRREIGAARRLGEAVRAMAVVRVEGGDGAIEIEIVDLATEKVLIAQVPRPRRDEDLYRALALKIRAGLRATLSEDPERLQTRAGLVRLALSPPGPSASSGSAAAAADRWSLETGYQLFAFPLAGVTLQGLSVSASYAPRPWLELALGAAVLDSAHAAAAGVSAVGTVVPFAAVARLRVAGEHLEALAGPALGVAYVGIDPSSDATAVRATRHLVPALGVDAEGRLRLRGPAFVYARAAAMGVLLGERYRAEGQVVLDTSRFQASMSAGIGIGLR